MSSLPNRLRRVVPAVGTPFYRWTPPVTALKAGIIKGWTCRNLDEAITNANRDNKIVDDWREDRIVLRKCKDEARISHLIGEYFSSPAYLRLADSSKHQYLQRIKAWKSLRLGGAPLWSNKLSTITTPQCQRMYDDLIASGAGVVAANESLTLYRLLFNFAIRLDYVQHNPFKYVKSVSTKQRRVVWTKEQVRAFLNVAFSKFEWRNIGVIVYCAYEWGQRPGDMIRLKWSDYDVEKGLLTLTQRKRGETVTLPASKGLQAVLKQQYDDFSFQEYIAPYPRRKSARPFVPYSLQNFHHACCNIMSVANLPPELTIRDLRRTAITEMVEMGVPLPSIMSVSGHATIESLNPYVKKTLRAATLAQDMRGINNFTLEGETK